jgi:hypothetical protein
LASGREGTIRDMAVAYDNALAVKAACLLTETFGASPCERELYR